LLLFASDAVRAGATDETVQAEVRAGAVGWELSGVEACPERVVARVVQCTVDEFSSVGAAALFRGVVGPGGERISARKECSCRRGADGGKEVRWNSEEVVVLELAADKEDGFTRAEIVDSVVEEVLRGGAAGAGEVTSAEEGHAGIGTEVGGVKAIREAGEQAGVGGEDGGADATDANLGRERKYRMEEGEIRSKVIGSARIEDFCCRRRRRRAGGAGERRRGQWVSGQG
jgi:hypothetical protein